MTRQGLRPTADGSPGEQDYLATASDLVSALIFVFIIMLAVFAYQLAQTTEGLNAADETRQQILNDIASQLEESGMRVEVLAEQGVLRLSENAINFPSGRETPNPDHRINVGRLARAIGHVVPCYVSSTGGASLVRDAGTSGPEAADGSDGPAYCAQSGDPSTYDCNKREHPWLLETLLIEGHTDDVPVAVGNRFRDNLELSSMRAATVHRMIAACEPAVTGLQNTEKYPVLSTSGYGYNRPATLDPERADSNRRIDLRFLMEPPEGILEGEPAVQTDVREQIGNGRP